MKQSRFLTKIVIIIILVCLLITCGLSIYTKNEKKHKEETTSIYTIAFRDSLLGEKLKWSNDILYKVIEPRHYSEDWTLEEKAFESIDRAMTSWISGLVLDATDAHLEIYCHSANYLSFVNSLEFSYRRIDYIHDYITIDMKTGERVMLDDIIRIDEEFVEFIQNNDVLQKTISDIRYGADLETLNDYTSEELLDELKACSKTQQEIIEEGYCSIEDSIGPLLKRNSFFLRENQLVIVIGYAPSDEHHFVYNLEDISDFLKVEKW